MDTLIRLQQGLVLIKDVRGCAQFPNLLEEICGKSHYCGDDDIQMLKEASETLWNFLVLLTHRAFITGMQFNISEQQAMIQENNSCFHFPVFQSKNVPQLLIELNCAVNALLLIITTTGNTLFLAAVWRTTSLRSPFIIFLCGLATTDLAVGVVVQPVFLSMELKILRNSTAYNCALGKTFIIVSHTVCGVSLLTVTAISLDRLLALRYHMRYASFVTVRRVLYVIVFNWLISGFLASLILWSTRVVFLIIMAVAVAVCICLSTSVHVAIYRIVRRHQQQIKAQVEAVKNQNSVHFKRLQRTSAIAYLVHYLLLICYTPLFVTFLLTSNDEEFSSELWKHKWSTIAWKLANTVVFLNSALNSFIYCWRLQEIRNATVKTICLRKWLCKAMG